MMEKTVLKQVDELSRMSMAQLRKRWGDLMGADPGRLGRAYLIRRLAYRVQELAFGGLSQEARQQLAAIADGKGPKGPRAKRRKMNLAVGTRLLRDWNGRRYEVVVEQEGLLYDGQHYRSLTAVAEAITGSHWNGNRFFGITRPAGKRGKA